MEDLIKRKRVLNTYSSNFYLEKQEGQTDQYAKQKFVLWVAGAYWMAGITKLSITKANDAVSDAFGNIVTTHFTTTGDHCGDFTVEAPALKFTFSVVC